MKRGVLYLIKSKRPPVFVTPMAVRYTTSPQEGQAFLFETDIFRSCNLSTTKAVTQFAGFVVVETRNSFYVLVERP